MNQAAMNNATDIMRKLLDQGLLKHTEVDGQVVPVESFEEYQQQRDMKVSESQSQQTQQNAQFQSIAEQE